MIRRSLNKRFALSSLLLLMAIGALASTFLRPMLTHFDRPELVATLVIGASITALASLLAVGAMSRRLLRLVVAVEAFVASDFRDRGILPAGNSGGDEIDRLAAGCAALARRVLAQGSELEQGAVRRRELLANVSHDLRTPLTSMQGYLEALLLERESLSADQQRAYLEIATRNCEGLGRLLADLCQLTTLEAGEVRLRAESFDVSELLHDIGQKFRLKAERKQIRLDVQGADAPAAVIGDIALVERLVDNLLENAIRYTPMRGIVRLEAQRLGDDTVAVSVADTGPGMDPDEVPRIFERYYRTPRHAAATPEGTGLGLAIARRIALLHGADLAVRTAPGAGTTMRFVLRAAP